MRHRKKESHKARERVKVRKRKKERERERSQIRQSLSICWLKMKRHIVVDLSFIYLNQIRVCGLWSESIFHEFGIDRHDVIIPFDTTGTVPGFQGLRHGST